MQNEDTTESPVARTISVIGSSWTCLILRDFFQHGPRRFQQLQDSLQGIAPTTLSERLRTLEENGVVERRFYSMNPLFYESAAGRGRPRAKGSRPRPDRPCHARLGAQVRALTRRRGDRINMLFAAAH